MASVPHSAPHTTPIHGDHAHDGHDDHHHVPTGFMRYVTTTNHKDIGSMYLWFRQPLFCCLVRFLCPVVRLLVAGRFIRRCRSRVVWAWI